MTLKCVFFLTKCTDLNKLLEGSNKYPVRFVEVEDGDVSPAVGVGVLGGRRRLLGLKTSSRSDGGQTDDSNKEMR